MSAKWVQFAWAVAVVASVLSRSSDAQGIWRPSTQVVINDRSVNVNQTDVTFDNQRNLNVWNNNSYETNILVVPPEALPQREVILRQTVTLRGDFTEWRGVFGDRGIVISRRGSDFYGSIVTHPDRLDAATSPFFSFSQFMMMNGQVRYGQVYRYAQPPYEVNVQLGMIEPYGMNIMSMSFNLLVTEDKGQASAPQEFDVTSVVWEGLVQTISTPVGDFHLWVDPNDGCVRLDKCAPPGSTLEPTTIERLSKDSLVDAIQTEREITHSEKGFTLIVKFTEAEFDPDDGRIKTIHAQVCKSRS